MNLQPLAIILLAPGAATCQSFDVSDLGPNSAPAAIIDITNEHGSGTMSVLVSTPLGPVRLTYITSMNSRGGCCPDTVKVTEWPEGVHVTPHEQEIEEESIGRVELYIYQGG